MNDVLHQLIGKTMWTCRRAADMATFQFGERRHVRSFKGEPAEVGEYALHVQCPWRIVREDTIIVGNSDLYYPSNHDVGKDVPQTFDWDRDPSRRDVLLRQLFENGAREFRVLAVRAGVGGALQIEFEINLRLELFPNDSLGHEHWRLFTPATDGPEIVVIGPSWPS